MTRKQRIEEKLTQALQPSLLTVEDESIRHHVPKGAETHFKVTAVSSHFTALTRIQRHKLVNQLLNEEFNLGLHALSLHLYTAEEWGKRSHPVQNSPACKDGFER